MDVGFGKTGSFGYLADSGPLSNPSYNFSDVVALTQQMDNLQVPQLTDVKRAPTLLYMQRGRA